MMKTIIWIFILAVFVFFVAGVRIEFKPFRIHFDSWAWALGWVLISAGVIIISVAKYREGLERGRDITIETLKEIVN